jgi:hypothetical protein
MITPAEIFRRLERRLHAAGFTAPLVRRLLGTQVLLSAAGLGSGAALAWYSLWPLAFGIGAGIATYSLWQIARFSQGCISRNFSAALGVRLFMGFTFRLVLIGVVLFGLIVLLRAPVVPLLLGLGSTVASIALWGLARFPRKTVKEA